MDYLYTSKKWYVTGRDQYAIAGNASFLVDKRGVMHFTGTSYSIDYYLVEFDAIFKNTDWD